LAANVKRRIVRTPIIDIPDLERIDELHDKLGNRWEFTATVLIYKGRIYVPMDDLLRNKVLSLFHNNPESYHFGPLRTAELQSWDFHWPAMDATIQKYIAR